MVPTGQCVAATLLGDHDPKPSDHQGPEDEACEPGEHARRPVQEKEMGADPEEDADCSYYLNTGHRTAAPQASFHLNPGSHERSRHGTLFSGGYLDQLHVRVNGFTVNAVAHIGSIPADQDDWNNL